MKVAFHISVKGKLFNDLKRRPHAVRKRVCKRLYEYECVNVWMRMCFRIWAEKKQKGEADYVKMYFSLSPVNQESINARWSSDAVFGIVKSMVNINGVFICQNEKCWESKPRWAWPACAEAP